MHKEPLLQLSLCIFFRFFPVFYVVSNVSVLEHIIVVSVKAVVDIHLKHFTFFGDSCFFYIYLNPVESHPDCDFREVIEGINDSVLFVFSRELVIYSIFRCVWLNDSGKGDTR